MCSHLYNSCWEFFENEVTIVYNKLFPVSAKGKLIMLVLLTLCLVSLYDDRPKETCIEEKIQLQLMLKVLALQAE